MGKRWPFLLLLLVGIAGLTAVWSRSAPAPRQALRPALGGGYVEGVAGRAERLDPLFDQENEVDAGIDALVFAGLTRLDDRGVAFPDLAERWETSTDGLVYTFHLRADLLWQDGFPVTAADAAFTYRLLGDATQPSPPPAAAALSKAAITEVDPQTLTITLDRPFAGLPAYLSLGLLPAHTLSSVPASALHESSFNQHPVGAGPFKVEELTEDHAVLVPNPAYHFGQPYIQRFEMRFYPDDGSLLTAMRSGAIDGAYFGDGLSSHDVDSLQALAGIKITDLPGDDLTMVDFNLQSEQLTNLRVRQALVYAVNRSTLTSAALDDGPAEAQSLMAPGTWAYWPAFGRYNYDPALAAALLDDAGWRLNGGAGRTKSGIPLALRFVTNDDPVRVGVAKAIMRQWQAVGVQVDLVTVPATAYTREVLPGRSYDALLFTDRLAQDPDPYAIWHSSGIGAKGRNFTGFVNQRADKLLESGRSAQTSEARASIYRDLQDLLATEIPAFPLFASTAVYAQRTDVLGQRLSFAVSPGTRFWQVQDWYVKTR